jgi:hypothetical protein
MGRDSQRARLTTRAVVKGTVQTAAKSGLRLLGPAGLVATAVIGASEVYEYAERVAMEREERAAAAQGTAYQAQLASGQVPGSTATFAQFFQREAGRAANASDVQRFTENLAQGMSEFDAAREATKRGRKKRNPCDEEDDQKEDLVTIYRGVHKNHPDLPNAKKGTAVPRGGPATPAEHNAGDNRSEYTSWTTRESTADYYADRYGPGGVKLTLTVPESQLIPSPDTKNEAEVFLRGTVSGAQVTEMTGQNTPRRRP